MFKKYFLVFLILIPVFPFYGQAPKKLNSSEIYHELKKLNFLGSALYIAAHPDDENTRLISHLVNEIHARTAYLSITRGDGGQNLIGTELRELLGVIRTQELLEARKIDGGKQFFTSANDFGYSKNPEETFKFWNKKQLLEEFVQLIRQFKPDIIINRFDHRNPGTTHGHHTASAMLSYEAFDLAADNNFHSKSKNSYGLWTPERLFFNLSWWFYGSEEKFLEAIQNKDYINLDIGKFYPVLGKSNGEIAAKSRSKHQSQGFGTTGTRGESMEYLEFLKGSPITDNNLFEGINTTWSRIKGGQEIGDILYPLEENFDFKNPSKIIPQLLKAYPLIANLEDEHWRNIKLKQLENLILHASGIFLEARTSQEIITPGEEYPVTTEIINRGKHPVILTKIENTTKKRSLLKDNISLKTNITQLDTFKIKAQSEHFSAPYWLKKPHTEGMYQVPDGFLDKPATPSLETIRFHLQFKNINIPYSVPVVYKTNDAVTGEVYQPLAALPKTTLSIPEKITVFSSGESQEFRVKVKSHQENIQGVLKLSESKSWKIEPQEIPFSLPLKGEEKEYVFKVTPTNTAKDETLKVSVEIDNEIFDQELFTISYNHIPTQRVLLPATAKFVNPNIKKKGTNIGYIEGAGDLIPKYLRQIGYQITIIPPNAINLETLKKFDAVIMGIRAYNVVPQLEYVQNILNEYVFQGGNLLVQYNTNHQMATNNPAPFPLTISRKRVTDEYAPVTFLAPKHPVLNKPNKITHKDFEDWVQERGLYFPDTWSEEFTPILGISDPGEDQTKGSLLVASYGKGYYIYTGLSFFRQLPEGVSGAYRLLTNILSLGKK